LKLDEDLLTESDLFLFQICLQLFYILRVGCLFDSTEIV